MEIITNLNNEPDEKSVLQILGMALGYTDDKFWGKNWDAFNDILRYLDKGGIWGDNQIFSFPLVLQISNFQNFQSQAPQKFAIFNEILAETKQNYAKDGRTFDYKFIE